MVPQFILQHVSKKTMNSCNFLFNLLHSQLQYIKANLRIYKKNCQKNKARHEWNAYIIYAIGTCFKGLYFYAARCTNVAWLLSKILTLRETLCTSSGLGGSAPSSSVAPRLLTSSWPWVHRTCFCSSTTAAVGRPRMVRSSLQTPSSPDNGQRISCQTPSGPRWNPGQEHW